MSTIPRVEVCIWLPKDEKGNYADAFVGGLATQKGGRVGHASLKIYPEQSVTVRNKFIEKGGHVYVSLWPQPEGFRETYEMDCVKGLPEATISLSKLDVPKMLNKYGEVREAWTLISSDTSHRSGAHSCSGLVLKLLREGGIYERYVYARYAGPRGVFYYETNCHLGEKWGGYFNAWIWRGWSVSPKLVLHVAASAVEYDEGDKKRTVALMESSSDEKIVVGAQAVSIFAKIVDLIDKG